MAKKPTTKASKTPKKAIQAKISVKPVKNPMMGEKAMPMMASGKKMVAQNMMKQEKVKKVVGKPHKGKK